LRLSTTPSFAVLFGLLIISVLEAVISFSGFAVLVFVISGGINELDFIPKYLLTLNYLILFYLIRFVFSAIIEIIKRRLLINMSKVILLKLWGFCDTKPDSDLNSRLLSNEVLYITQGYQSITVLISESLMAIFIIVGIILNIKLSFVTYSILGGSTIIILLILYVTRIFVKNLTQKIFDSGSVFAEKISYYYNHFLSLKLRGIHDDYKIKSQKNYFSFLNSVVTKSSVKAFTPISIESVGIISCLLIIFLAGDIDKIAFIAFVVRLISSFNRLSNGYQGLVSKKAIEEQIQND
jgi:hypothetical protein